jgi:hypothetical protein
MAPRKRPSRRKVFKAPMGAVHLATLQRRLARCLAKLAKLGSSPCADS